VELRPGRSASTGADRPKAEVRTFDLTAAKPSLLQGPRRIKEPAARPHSLCLLSTHRGRTTSKRVLSRRHCLFSCQAALTRYKAHTPPRISLVRAELVRVFSLAIQSMVAGEIDRWMARG